MKKYIVSDGWHTFYGIPLWVENGCIIRGLILCQGDYVTAYPYKNPDTTVTISVAEFPSRTSENFGTRAKSFSNNGFFRSNGKGVKL